jgi:type IV secretion system protein VirB1
MDYTNFTALMEACAPNVAIETMAAIVQQESNFNQFSIGVNGDYVLKRQPKSKEEALESVTWLIKEKQSNLDIGIAQINTKNLTKYSVSIEEAFDPCTNIKVGAAILTDNYQRALESGMNGQGALQAAISEYNTGSIVKGFKNGYVQKIIDNVKPLVVTVPALEPNPSKTSTTTISKSVNNPQSKEAVQFTQDDKYSQINVYQSKKLNTAAFVYKSSEQTK